MRKFFGAARQGLARRGEAGPGEAGLGWAGLGKAGPGKARRGWAGQGGARRGCQWQRLLERTERTAGGSLWPPALFGASDGRYRQND